MGHVKFTKFPVGGMCQRLTLASSSGAFEKRGSNHSGRTNKFTGDGSVDRASKPFLVPGGQGIHRSAAWLSRSFFYGASRVRP